MREILAATEQAFSLEASCSELRRIFRSAAEFYTLRGALLKLRRKQSDSDSQSAEADVNPHLHRLTSFAFPGEH